MSATAGSTSVTIKSGGIVTYTATYTLTPTPAFSGKIKNTVLATASSPGNSGDVQDQSDDGDDTDFNTLNDQTDVITTAQASLTVTKSAVVSQTNGNSTTEAGDVIIYTIGIKNTGGVTLIGLNLNDTLTDANSSTLNLTSGPTFVSASAGSTSQTIVTSGTVTYTATYIIGTAPSYTGKIINKVLASATGQGGNVSINDTSDDPSTATPNDVTVVNIDPFAQMEVTKTASVTDDGDGNIGAGDVINYTITIENKGNVALTGMTISDTLTDGNSSTLSMTNGPNFAGSTMGSNTGTLKAGEKATYLAYYIISTDASLTGAIINTVSATASSPGQTNNVSDTSDDGDDTDGNTVSDTTNVFITPLPSVEATKTATVSDVNGNSQNDSGDIITYSITISNTGNVSLTSLIVSDTLTDANGSALSLNGSPTFVSASAGSTSTSIAVGGNLTYTASYTITQLSANTGSIQNSVLVILSSP